MCTYWLMGMEGYRKPLPNFEVELKKDNNPNLKFLPTTTGKSLDKPRPVRTSVESGFSENTSGSNPASRKTSLDVTQAQSKGTTSEGSPNSMVRKISTDAIRKTSIVEEPVGTISDNVTPVKGGDDVTLVTTGGVDVTPVKSGDDGTPVKTDDDVTPIETVADDVRPIKDNNSDDVRHVKAGGADVKHGSVDDVSHVKTDMRINDIPVIDVEDETPVLPMDDDPPVLLGLPPIQVISANETPPSKPRPLFLESKDSKSEKSSLPTVDISLKK